MTPLFLLGLAAEVFGASALLIGSTATVRPMPYPGLRRRWQAIVLLLGGLLAGTAGSLLTRTDGSNGSDAATRQMAATSNAADDFEQDPNHVLLQVVAVRSLSDAGRGSEALMAVEQLDGRARLLSESRLGNDPRVLSLRAQLPHLRVLASEAVKLERLRTAEATESQMRSTTGERSATRP